MYLEAVAAGEMDAGFVRRDRLNTVQHMPTVQYLVLFRLVAVCTFGEYDTLDRPGGVGNRALELVLGDDLDVGADVAAIRELVDPFLAGRARPAHKVGPEAPKLHKSTRKRQPAPSLPRRASVPSVRGHPKGGGVGLRAKRPNSCLPGLTVALHVVHLQH